MSAPGILAIGTDAAWRVRLYRLLAMRPELCWLGAYAPGEHRKAGTHAPEMLLLDGDDPRVLRPCRRPRLPAPPRIYFYSHPDRVALEQCTRAGALGCLQKRAAADVVLRAIAAADSGLFVMTPALLSQMHWFPMRVEVHREVPQAEATRQGEHGPGLSERQRQIVACVGAGLSNKQIARLLGISPETVKTHLRAAFEREGVHARAALLAAVRAHAQPGDAKSV